MKILVLGSNGMVGTSILNLFSLENEFKIIPSTRKDTNLFIFNETERLINETKRYINQCSCESWWYCCEQ